MKAKPWTEKHRREALAYLLTLCREDVLARPLLHEGADREAPFGHSVAEVWTEAEFVLVLEAIYEDADAKAAVCFVRNLADEPPRKVRETVWRADWSNGFQICAWLDDLAVVAFRAGKDDRATLLRDLARQALAEVVPTLRKSAERHGREFPASPFPDEEDDS